MSWDKSFLFRPIIQIASCDRIVSAIGLLVQASLASGIWFNRPKLASSIGNLILRWRCNHHCAWVSAGLSISLYNQVLTNLRSLRVQSKPTFLYGSIDSSKACVFDRPNLACSTVQVFGFSRTGISCIFLDEARDKARVNLLHCLRLYFEKLRSTTWN